MVLTLVTVILDIALILACDMLFTSRSGMRALVSTRATV